MKSNTPSTGSDAGDGKDLSDPGRQIPTKTPMYEAMYASRYHRQTLMKEIGAESDCTLICYVSGKAATIDRDDVVGFVEMLHNIEPEKNVDLLLHTRGGDVDAAEKMMTLVQATVGSGRFRVIVPDFAKSAGTLMVLGADSLIMSDSSELGTIDPQIWSHDENGKEVCHSVLSYLDAFNTYAQALKKDPDDPVARTMLNKLDPTTHRTFESIRDRARNFAEDQLKRKGRNFSQIAGALLDTARWPSHGQMIKWQDVKELGLPVEYVSPRSKRWQAYWQLYCLLRLAVKDRQNIFESAYASLILDQ